MERHLVTSSVCSEVQSSLKRTRQTYDDETVRTVTEKARHFRTARAVVMYNRDHVDCPISESTVRTWLKHWKDNGTYFSISKRGRPEALTALEKQATLEAMDKLRAAPNCEALSARTVAAVARGVVSQTRPTVLQKHGGGLQLGREWATKVLHKEAWTPLARTSDRTVSDDSIAAASEGFYSQLRECGAPRTLVFNVDEFAVVLGQNRKWTWQRQCERRSVAIRDCRECFTCSVLTCAAGDLVELQLIWKGSTNLVHAKTSAPHPKLVQDHQPSSHFQNANTWSRLLQRLCSHVAQMRRTHYRPDMPAVLVVDAAPQHSGVDLLSAEGIQLVEIPKKMTHVYQPADQYVIRGLKSKADVAWDEYVETLFAAHNVDDAVAELTVRNKPVIRSRMYRFLAHAVEQLGASAIVSSWEASGISRAIWCDVPVHAPVIDRITARVESPSRFARICSECGEQGDFRSILPTCSHFADVATAILCQGCFNNHEELC